MSPAASFVLCLLIRRATPQHNIQALLDVLPSTCTVFVEVVYERDVAVPGLYFTAASPLTDVNGFGRVENYDEELKIDIANAMSNGGLS